MNKVKPVLYGSDLSQRSMRSAHSRACEYVSLQQFFRNGGPGWAERRQTWAHKEAGRDVFTGKVLVCLVLLTVQINCYSKS